jgi:hypothetical protein
MQAEGEQYGHPAVCFFTVIFKVRFLELSAFRFAGRHQFLCVFSLEIFTAMT